jgi:hypothetical protein
LSDTLRGFDMSSHKLHALAEEQASDKAKTTAMMQSVAGSEIDWVEDMLPTIDEESAMEMKIPSSVIIPPRRMKKWKLAKVFPSLVSAALAAVIVFSYNSLAHGARMGYYHIPYLMPEEMPSPSIEQQEQRQLRGVSRRLLNEVRSTYNLSAEPAEDEERPEIDIMITEIVMDTWPECAKYNIPDAACRTIIDEEILTLVTGQGDRDTRPARQRRRVVQAANNMPSEVQRRER